VSQGPVAERNLEKLGKSDEGIILFRRMLLDELKRVQAGQEPSINVFRDEAQNQCIAIPLERVKYATRLGVGPDAGYRPLEAGVSRDAGKIEEVMRTWAYLDPKWVAGESAELEPVAAGAV
jgi:hypothetical protein